MTKLHLLSVPWLVCLLTQFPLFPLEDSHVAKSLFTSDTSSFFPQPLRVSPTSSPDWSYTAFQMQNLGFSKIEDIFKIIRPVVFLILFLVLKTWWFSPAKHTSKDVFAPKPCSCLSTSTNISELQVVERDIIVELMLKLQTLALLKPQVTISLWLISRIWSQPKMLLSTPQNLSLTIPDDVNLVSHKRHVQLFVTPWTIQSMEFSRPYYWSG